MILIHDWAGAAGSDLLFLWIGIIIVFIVIISIGIAIRRQLFLKALVQPKNDELLVPENNLLEFGTKHERKADKILHLQSTLSLFRTIIESLPFGVLVIDRNFKVITWNKEFSNMWNVSTSLLMQDSVKLLKFMADQVIEPELFLSHLQLPVITSKEQDEFEIQFKDGRIYECYTKQQTIKGDRIEHIWNFRDITARINAEKMLHLQAQALESDADAILIIDIKQPEQPIVYVNHAFERITGYSAQEAIGRNCRFLQGNDTDQSGLKFIRLAQQELRDTSVTLRNYKKDGSMFWNELHIAPIEGSDGKVHYYMGSFSDISHRIQAEEKLVHQATYDNLTSLPNRTLLTDRIEQAIVYAKRFEALFAIIYIDLDHFKNINDELGHLVGDLLLKAVSQRLLACVRESDTVARLGGDEFAILVASLKNEFDAEMIAKKILEGLKIPFAIEEHQINVTASLGICFYPQDGEDGNSLLRNADMAMYQAKQDGRNNYKFYTENLSKRVGKRLSVGSYISNALETGQLFLHYQPMVDVKTGKIVSLEALLRWEKLELEIESVADLIELAEEAGLSVKLSEWIINAACLQMVQWKQEGKYLPPMAINLSLRQFTHVDFMRRLNQIIGHHELTPDLFLLELTEGAVMNNIERATIILHELRGQGYTIVIDDFGLGHFSINHLKQFPISKIKIDKSFIQKLPNDKDAISTIVAVSNLGKSLGLKVVAEGVETKDQLLFLKDKCDEIQGFYYSEPVAAEVCGRFLFRGFHF